MTWFILIWLTGFFIVCSTLYNIYEDFNYKDVMAILFVWPLVIGVIFALMLKGDHK